MSSNIKVALAGAGAFGIKHLDGIQLIDGVQVVSLIGRELGKTQAVADKYGIAHVTTDLNESLAIKEVDAVILCTPTQMHASQALACLRAGKHVQVEIPLCDVYQDGAQVVALQKQTGLVAMCGHTRRFNPSHQFVHQQILAGKFNLYQMDVQQHECARSTPQLDRPFTVAPCSAHRRSIRLPSAQPHRKSQRYARADPLHLRHRHGYEHSIASGQWGDMHAIAQL